MSLSGKNILITGASQGLGRYLAVHFAKGGNRIIMAARNKDGLAETARRIAEAGGQCVWHGCDLCDPESIRAFGEFVKSETGGVDILINNAADLTSRMFLDTTFEQIESLARTNFIGLLQLTRLVAPMMVEKGGGVIVNISSLGGYKANPGQAVYCATKTGVNGISDALRVELEPKGVHIINVALPSVAAELPCKPHQHPPDYMAAILERAIERREPEVFLSPVSKWLMRLYKFLPALARVRRGKAH